MKVVAYYDDGWIGPPTERAMWSALCRAYQVEYQLVRAWAAAELPEGLPVICLDERSSSTLEDVPRQMDAVWVIGSSGQEVLRDVPHQMAVRIPTPRHVALYGCHAAAIMLHYMRGSTTTK
jgi:hypothetical protein